MTSKIPLLSVVAIALAMTVAGPAVAIDPITGVVSADVPRGHVLAAGDQVKVKLEFSGPYSQLMQTYLNVSGMDVSNIDPAPYSVEPFIVGSKVIGTTVVWHQDGTLSGTNSITCTANPSLANSAIIGGGVNNGDLAGNGDLVRTNALQWLFSPVPTPTSTPTGLVSLTLGPTRMRIRDWRDTDEHEFAVGQPIVTLYGRNVVPVTVGVADAGGHPVTGGTVTLHATPIGAPVGPLWFGFSADPAATEGPDAYPLTIDDPTGTRTIYFRVEDLYKNVIGADPNATAFEITAELGTATAGPKTLTVFDNRQKILDEYSFAKEYIQDGARSSWRDAFKPPLTAGGVGNLPGAMASAVVKPGNNLVGSIKCGTYQSWTLIFLNDIRHSDDGWKFNGLEYSPVQTTYTEHHFVALYPHGLDFHGPRTIIMDPWLAQTVASYTWNEFVLFIDQLHGGSQIVPDVSHDVKNPGTCVFECLPGVFIPPYYPAAGGRYPYFPENASLPIKTIPHFPGRYDACQNTPHDWCERNGIVTRNHRNDAALLPEDHATVVIGSPVKFYATMDDGRHFGFAPGDLDTLVNDFAAELTTAFLEYLEPAGGRGWYVELPPGRRFHLEFPPTGSGTMSVAIAGTGGVIWGAYLDVPIGGTPFALDVDLDGDCGPAPVPGGGTVACTRPQHLERCEDGVDDDADGNVDRIDDDCPVLADGASLGLGDGGRGKVLTKCQTTLLKAGIALLKGTHDGLTKCSLATLACLETGTDSAPCLAKAGPKCAKELTKIFGVKSLQAKFLQAGLKACTKAPLVLGDLLAASGIGYSADASFCADVNVSALDTPTDVLTCIARRLGCRAAELSSFETPRARELLALGGLTPADFPCLDFGATGAGQGLADATTAGKSLVKTQSAIAKVAGGFASTATKRLQSCVEGAFACVQTKTPADPACVAKATAACAKLRAKLSDGPKSDLAKARAKLVAAARGATLADLLDVRGLGFGIRAPLCAELGVSGVGSVEGLADCLLAHHGIRAEQTLEHAAPRAHELLELIAP